MIRAFLKEYRFWYSQYLLLIAGNTLVFYLFHLPMYDLVVASMVTLSILVLFSMGKYGQFKARIEAIELLQPEQQATTTSLFPLDLAYRSCFEQQFAKMRKNLEESTESQSNIEAMIKMWVHQMKLPIAALSLMEQSREIDQQEFHYQLAKMDNALNQLLNFLKFKQHHDDFRFEQFYVSSLVKALLKEMSYTCIQKNIAVSIEGDWYITSDRKWLQFALGQLLDNAIKYSKQNGSIKVSIDRGSIKISDKGIGILKEDLPRLFEDGFTGFNGHEHQKASGLGLYMTKHILNQLELRIIVDSIPDQGTVVTILPNP